MIQPIRDNVSQAASVEWDLLRLDRLHPVVSGNKIFKLGPYLEQAIQQQSPGVIGFGGAWSNHIHALAYAAREKGLASFGLIRGEKPAGSNEMLDDCRRWGMELRFLSRQTYRQITDTLKSGSSSDPIKDCAPVTTDKLASIPADLQKVLPTGWLVVPEGGYGQWGMEGAAGIWAHIPGGQYTHILCAVGTGTMVAGLALARHRRAAGADTGTDPHLPQIIGLPVLQHEGLELEIGQLLGPAGVPAMPLLLNRFHGGGYAKTGPELLDFMSGFYLETGVPTDIIYTAKLFRGIQQLIREGFFPVGSRLLAIHSGGLQGNRSLKKGILPY